MARTYSNAQAIDIRQRIRWYAMVRFLFLLALTLPGIISLYAFEGFSPQVVQNLALLAIALLSNVLFYVLIRSHENIRYLKTLTAIWIGLDILLATTVIFTNGGIESRSPILYTLPILISAAIFGRIATYVAAVICSQLYMTLILADYAGIIQTIGAFDPTLRTRLPYVINSIVFIPSILLVIALAVDFITRLLIEKQHQAADSLEALVRAQHIAKMGSWEWDIRHNEVSWSEGLLNIFGVRDHPERFTYEKYLTHIHPDDTAMHRRTIDNAIRHRAPFKVDHRIILEGGEGKYIHGEGRPILDKHGHLVKLSGTAQDVTELHNLDDAKREFVSLASHQLRTPASGVKAFLSLLLDGYAGDVTRKQREFLRKAYESNDRQLDIIDNLLSLAAIESGKMKLRKSPQDITKIVRKCLRDQKPEIRAHKHRLVTKFAKNPIIVNADATHLQMVIDNLISNAIKYTPDNGSISVGTTGSGNSVYIDIEDTGIGIRPDKHSALFKKFSRISDPSSRTVGGSGLGLYLAKHIAILHRGNITVRSQIGKGTRFRIRLPIYHGKV
jgi:signal transduction histidine kinase